MNYKRGLATGVMLWVVILITISILRLIPWFLDRRLILFGIFWVLLIPEVLLMCKWYFKMDEPNLKKGFGLGVVLLLVTLALDVIITVPLFVKSYSVFFGDWMMYVGYAEILILSICAGFEFDKTFTKIESKK